MELFSELVAKEVEIENLFLNPNNPRLMGKSRTNDVDDNRIKESDIQNSLLEEIEEEGISDIVEKIKKLGFLTIDRIVVRQIKNSPDNYLVLEGNRRIASVKTLLKEHAKGIVTLNNEILKSLKKIEVLEYIGNDEDIIWLLQGMRHINGIKEWGALQQARFLHEMQNSRKLKATELDKMTGLGRNSISNKIRSYKAYQYSKEVYHGEIEENNFSLFQEVIFARPIIKQWLDWDDVSNKFQNETNLELILNWYLGDEEDKKRIPRAIDLRDFLNQALLPDNKTYLEKFINVEEYTVKEAIQDISTKDAVKSAQKNQLNLVERLNQLDEFITSLSTLPVNKIVTDEELLKKYIEKINEIVSTSSFQSDMLKKFLKSE
jgi:hypothetical protein